MIDSIRVESTVEKHKYFLFGEYTFLLINLLPLIHYTETVNLYLDFSYGELYNAFIQENLLFFSQIGLVITQEIDYSTDIVLTNRLDDILIEKIEYIVWLTPPRVVDWSALAELILIIKQKKYRAESDKRNSIEKG